MKANINSLLAACDELGVAYRPLHPSGHAYAVGINGRDVFFISATTPLNDQGAARLFKDKEYVYRYLRGHVRMPRTVGFVNPGVGERMQPFLTHTSLPDIIRAITEDFGLPVIIKRNSGTGGQHVYLCEDDAAITEALEQIFAPHQRNYDHVALAQEYVPVKEEYRVVVLQNEIVLMFEKGFTTAPDTDPLDPLYRDYTRRVPVTDAGRLNEMRAFVARLGRVMSLSYVGLDVVRDPEGALWLLEINAAPNFSKFVRDNGPEAIVDLYKKMLAILMRDA